MNGRKSKKLRKIAREKAVQEVKAVQSRMLNSLCFMDRLKLAVRLLRRKF